MIRFTEDEEADLQAEFPRMRQPYRCSDGFCGAADCARCYANPEVPEPEIEIEVPAVPGQHPSGDPAWCGHQVGVVESGTDCYAYEVASSVGLGRWHGGGVGSR